MRAFQDMLLGPLKAVLMRALQQQLSKYIHNIELEGLGLMGGDVVLENLEIRKDVLHESLRIPTDYDISRGFIRELRIHIPWTRLQSRPIEIKFKTVEIIVTPIAPTTSHQPSSPWLHSRQSRPGEEQTSSAGATTGWLQQLLTKVLANMSVSVSNLVLKYEDADVVLSAALKSFVCFSANPGRDWTPAFASLDDPLGLLHKLVRASDLTVCLDRYCAPDPTGRRQVQAFEVPILNRASFDVRLLACVWLVAPGPPESSFAAAWEYQQAQVDWQDGAENDGAGIPSSPGKSGSRRGLPRGTGESPKQPTTPKTPRSAVTVLDRLVGGDRRAGGGVDEVVVEDLASGATIGSTEVETDELPLPCVCPLLRDGWSRRVSSSYSPFFDGEGVWSPSEAAGASVRGGEGVDASAGGARVEDGEEGGGVRGGGGGEEGKKMPTPSVVADVLIADLCFSLSNLQVQMMKELIDRAVHHVARNASRNTSARPLGQEDPRLIPKVAEPAARRWWPFGREAPLEDAGDDPRDDIDKAAYAKAAHGTPDRGSPAPFESRDRDAFFVVASTSVRSVDLRLLTHHAREGEDFGEKKDDEEAAADDEPESISVPVHGLGTVSILSAPVSARKQALRPPVAFVVAEVKGLALDAHVLAGGDDLSADVKVEVSSIVVRHAGLGDAASPKTSHHSTPSASGNILDQPEPVVTWGDAAVPAAPTANAEAANGAGAENTAPGLAGDRRPVADVQRLLVERARRLPRGGTGGEVGLTEASPTSEGTPRGRGGSASAQALPSPSPTWWADAPSCSATIAMPEECALQYRLLKRKSSTILREGTGGSDADSVGDAVSTVTSHTVAAGALRVQVAEVLLEKLLKFADVGRQAEKTESASDPAGNLDGEEKQNYGADAQEIASAAGALAQGQGLLWRANRLSPRASNAGSAVSSPRVLPFVQSFSSVSTWETSFSFSLRSVAMALDLDKAGGGGGVGSRGEDNSLGGFHQVACCVLSLGELDISGSESASVVSGDSQQQRRGWHAPTSERRESEVSQRVCSLSLGHLSVTFVDASALAAGERAPPASPWPVPRVFMAATLPGTQRLMQLSGARVTAEILSELLGKAGAGGVGGLARPISSFRGIPDFLFNASVESLHVGASIGAALVVLEVCLLARKMTGDIAGARVGYDHGYDVDRRSTSNGRWERCWRRVVGVSFDGVSLGGTVKGGGGQVKGNMRRLSVHRGGGGAPAATGPPRDVPDVALFQAMPGDGGGEGLSWTLETFIDEEGSTDIELTSAFKSGTLHYANTKKAVREVLRVLNEWKAGSARIGVGMTAQDAGSGTGPSSSPAVDRRSPSVKFNASGSVVRLHLPFELNLEVRGVHLGTRPGHQTLPAPNSGSADTGLDINLLAGDVQVFHALYGVRCSPEDALPPAIRCAARGIVTLRPAANATSVSLESEHVRARLTPAFCTAFGSFIRFMVGPPLRPTYGDSTALAAASRISHVPKVFTFKLRVRGVDVDFIGDPCSPSAVSANIVVGGVAMKQKSVGETLPGAGSKASFGMSFETVEGTQRRDPWRNAPAIPREAALLIRAFLGKVPLSDSDGGMSGGDLFSAWLSARKGRGGEHGAVGPSYTQPFIVRLSEEGRGADGTEVSAEAFSVLSTSSGPRQRLVNSLSLRLTPILLACYPPTFRLLVGHYNRFGGNAFRPFRSRADMPPRRIAVISYDIEIRGCSAVLLASLADGARGIHLSAGVVSIKENTAAAAAAVTPHAGLEPTQSSSLATDEPIDAETTLALSGFVGPAGMSYLQDWHALLPAAAAGAVSPTGQVEGATKTTQLCVPIDLRWAVFYDRLDRCRQDISLSSVQLYLEQSHFDLCVRVAQAFIAADYPGALPPRRRRSTLTGTNLATDNGTAAAGGQHNPVSSLSAHQTQTAAGYKPEAPAANESAVSNIAEVKSFLATSLRLPLLQCVLAVGKRNGPFPPVLEIDVASVRLVRGGILTVRHVSVNSWSQEVDMPMRPGAGVTMAAERGRSGCGYRVLGRSGQSEESGKDFFSMEVRVPDVQLVGPTTPGPTQPQLDVVIQVQPFDIHVNPSIICSLTSYVTPIPLAEDSSEAAEVPFPHFLPPVVTPFPSNCAPSASAAARDENPAPDSGGLERGSSAGERVSTDFEKSAMTASASVRLLASQVSLELSSYPGGPALIAGASHVFVRAITWPPDASRRAVSSDEGAHGRTGNGGRAQVGPEVFARVTRVTCGVKRGIDSDGDAALREDDRSGAPCRADEHGDTILKPFDIDVHLTRPRADPGAAAGIASKLSAARGWHAGVYVDELYLRFGAVHTRSLELLGNLFLPAMAAANLTATKLARGQREHGTVTGRQWQHRGHIGDLRALERVECAESIEETTVTPEPGEVVFYGVGAPQEGLREDKDTATQTSALEREERDGGWVHCCEWRYWGLRRVAQIALPYAPLSGSVPLLEGLAVDSLEVELSFVDPLTQTLEAATRFNVPCQESSGSPNVGFVGRKRVTVEPSQPFFARTWRLSWRIPAWLRSPATAAAAAAASPERIAISTWSSLLLQALSVYSSPAGPTAGPSYFSTTLVAQRVTLAVLTDGDARSSSSSLLPMSSRPPPPPGGGERGASVQLEEIVRMVIGDVSVFVEASSAAASLAATTRGSAEVAVDVQDFSNFLRLPLLSHALVKWDFATSGRRGAAVGGDEDLLSPLRPVAAAAVEVHNAVVSVSATSMQCVEQCIAELSQQSSGAVAAGEGSSTREMCVGTVESKKPPASACSPPPQRQPRQRSKRYMITNLTDRVLWFGQGSTTETLLLGAGEETSYRWRTTPAAVATASASRKDGISRLVLMLRLALHLDPGRLGDQVGADSESRADSGPWTEPFPAEDAGSYMRLLRSTGAGWQAGAKAPLTGVEGSDPMVLPLWVEVTKEGLQTRIVFHGEWVFTNHLPQEVQVAWVTSAGVGDAGRRLVEPVGMRGGLNLAACGPDKASDDSDAGQEAEVPHPGSCSALTACNPPTGSEPQRQERFSELMLEFRLVTPDASTVVGSVGPPPRPTGSPVAAPLSGRRSGVGEGLDDDMSGLEEDATSSAPWLVTRQSEWVEARPCVYLSLISCASPDPQSSGFWFWCVASRRASLLSDCAACVSRAAGHSCHLGQMHVDLRPVAVIWNRCSQPMRVALNFRGGRGEWRERNGPAFTQEVEQEQAWAQDGRGATRERHSNPAYGLSGLPMNVQPGGRTVACKQPFVDYDLAVTPATVESGRGLDSEARPFLVSVPSELLSRRSESRWIPLHSRALVDNVLCPLVVIASRLVNADWPSLSLRIYPGLSMHNHLRVPLSLRTVFTRQTLDVDRVTGTNDVPVAGGAEYGRTLEDEQAPLVHREASGGNAVPAGGGGVGVGGDGDGGSSSVAQDTPDSCLVRIVQAPAESCHSTWGIFHGGGYPIPYVLPALSLELGIASEEATASLPVTSAGVGTAAVGQEGSGEGATGTTSRESVERRSRKLKVRLDDHFRELVLIPWGEDGDVVLPVFVTLEREQILGGVELIKLAVYPRVVVHNATGLPISLSLLGAAKMGDDGNERTDGRHGETRGDAVPVCRVCLTPEGSESSMNVLALPGKRSVFAGPGSNYHDSSRAEGVVDAGRRSEPAESPARSGLFGKLSWLLGSSSYTVSPQPAGGFFADLEVTFGWDDAGKVPASGVPADGKGASVTTAVDEAAANAPGLGWHHPGVGESTIFSVGESSGGVPLRSEPSSLTVVAEGGQRAVRVCIAAETPDADRVPPTRHILLYRDPQPDITVCNRSGGPITLLFDCGTLVEVYPGCTAEHSWQEVENERSGRRERNSSTSSATARSSRLPSTAHPDHRGRGTSEMSDLLTPMSSAPGSPAASGRGGSESAGNRPGFAPSPGSIPAAAAARKPRPSGKLGGDATLRHCFQCKGGSKQDACVSWSDPLWVARGVQVIRFDNHGEEEGWDDPGGASDGGGGGGGSGDDGDDGQGGFGIGSAREVQVHVVERAGGFLMSFAEGGFDGEAADSVGVEGSGGDAAAAEKRGVLRRWATTREHHVVVSVSSTTLQLLDDSNLQAVAPIGHEASQTKGRTRETAARATSEGLGAMDGWAGGAWGEPGGFLSNGASTHLPAAALPAIVSVFVDATSARLWKTAPAVRPGMSALDLERSWHLKDRVGIDVRLGTVQVDNHVAGHSLPVLFCFRNGGSLASSNGTSGSGGDVTGDCRFTMTLILAQPWKESRVPSYLEKVRVRSAPIDVCLEDSLLPPLLQFLERAGLGIGAVDGSSPTDRSLHPSPRLSSWRPQLPPALSASTMARLFIQRVDIGVLVVRATVQGYIPGKQVFLALDKSPLLFRPVSLRGVLARPDQIAEQIASNYAVDALLRSLAVVGSLEALGSPTTLLSAWGKGVYDLFAMPIRALPQGPTSTVRATFRGVSSLLRHASAGTLSSVSGVTNALSRNLRSRGGVVRPIAGTMNLMHRTSRLLIASTGVDSEWAHAKAATEANPAVAHLNADLWYRWCLLPEGHEFLYQTPALCSNASYSQANVPVTIVLSSKAVFLYRGGSGCEELWKQIEHQDITLIEQSAEHAPAELILNARAYRRPRSASSSSAVAAAAARTTTQANSATPAVAGAAANAATATSDTVVVPGRSGAALEAEEVAVGGLLIKLSLPSSAWCRELAQLLHGLSGKA